ncbi:DNA helicase/exodeoxyribonuclease V, subunit A [Roseivivax halotolerans]|uniref:DNA 3'-5' helicase n=1 Tax=Roseivivax halotolerans TaxID=93684 RepID=A0A1I5V7K1_9RHOB|nr:double-strand break repair helicase AddA [Roseivivax halotolerans]SFQ03485.1 DNA helicase/exodeoxyribonuclease V, subunit A [Roseivivax halotolerans]
MRDDASEAQVIAARPGSSTWLSANAGSGKTRVLTDRVARLLLENVAPENILCLTYTKAAASEMQNRLFKRLGAWAMLPDADLRSELGTLGVDGPFEPVFLQKARTLFARAIETPGGLRIQTIHSFCAALLRRFPLEAQVSPDFREMEDRSAELLRAEILERMSAGPEAARVSDLALHFTGQDDSLDGLLKEVLSRKSAFFGGITHGDLKALYGVPPEYDAQSLLAETFLGSEAQLLARVRAAMEEYGGPTDQNNAARLAGITLDTVSDLAVLEEVFLTGKAAKLPFSAKAGSVPTKACQKQAGLADLMPDIDNLAARIEEARPKRTALAATERDLALHRFAEVFLPAYEAEKQARGWLDFDDLIEKAHELLSNSDVAEWVLYRLDGGIDHILVDEAQDTNPLQWRVIEKLAREFTAGQGARADLLRTIFVVGDTKQSIYSFQGADPDEFERMRAAFDARLNDAGTPLEIRSLAYSFRSAGPILQAVDATFDDADGSGFAPGGRHLPFHAEMPGQVDLWPVVPKPEKDEDDVWYEPVDRPAPTDATVVLAKRIARFIREAIERKQPLQLGQSAPRAMHAGDVLILVRRRGTLFAEIIRACKAEGLPVAGADRLKVMAERAVKDIGALLSFLATQEDNLSLAVALRSPLFGLGEQDLFSLAHKRKGESLWEQLRKREPDYSQTLAILNDLRRQADFLRPYDMIERILTRHNGRAKLIGRLGIEAEDGIDALLAQALAYESGAVPSLTGFLGWMQTDDLEIKRSPEAAGRAIRVMTVHGAKGLEAPVVILPDCAKAKAEHKGALLDLGPDSVVWKAKSEEMPEAQSEALEIAKARDKAERDRLLYVAMTRAEAWLVVAAASDIGKTPDESWYGQMQRGLERAGALPFASRDGEGLRLGALPDVPAEEASVSEEQALSLPDHFRRDAAVPLVQRALLSPSYLGGAKALPGDGDETEIAKARGTRIHALLEVLPDLPETDRPLAANRTLAGMRVPENDRAELAGEALSVLTAPELSDIFSYGALAEVPLTADLPRLGPMHGIIDRLIITPERVLAVDFKTNRQVPATADAVPEGLLRQMGAYRAMLSAIYPGRNVETAILWTATAQIMSLPAALTDAALARAAPLDSAEAAP